jgi:hypothetical protein
MFNSTLEKDLKEAERLSAETWYMETDKTKLDKPDYFWLHLTFMIIIGSALIGMLGYIVYRNLTI